MIVGATATLASGTAEREAARELIDHVTPRLPACERRSLSADAGYRAGDFLADLTSAATIR